MYYFAVSFFLSLSSIPSLRFSLSFFPLSYTHSLVFWLFRFLFLSLQQLKNEIIFTTTQRESLKIIIIIKIIREKNNNKNPRKHPISGEKLNDSI